jgi:hypothetical protein
MDICYIFSFVLVRKECELLFLHWIDDICSDSRAISISKFVHFVSVEGLIAYGYLMFCSSAMVCIVRGRGRRRGRGRHHLMKWMISSWQDKNRNACCQLLLIIVLKIRKRSPSRLLKWSIYIQIIFMSYTPPYQSVLRSSMPNKWVVGLRSIIGKLCK